MIVRAVRLSTEARRDLVRLADFLAQRNPRAADRASQVVSTAVLSLSTLSERSPVVIEPDWRELKVRFGRAGYVVRYRVVDEQVVFVSRIFHTLEQRSSWGAFPTVDDQPIAREASPWLAVE